MSVHQPVQVHHLAHLDLHQVVVALVLVQDRLRVQVAQVALALVHLADQVQVVVVLVHQFHHLVPVHLSIHFGKEIILMIIIGTNSLEAGML
jgi:hypothetical protein